MTNQSSIYASGPALVIYCRVPTLIAQVVNMHGFHPDGRVNLESAREFMFIDRETGEMFWTTHFRLSPKNILPLRRDPAEAIDRVAEVNHA